MTLVAEKLILNIEEMQEAFFDDAALIGLETDLRGYQLCQLLNDAFCLNFTREPEQDILVMNDDGATVRQFYPIYECLLPLCNDRYLLYKLRHGNESLLPELKSLDYLWIVQDYYPDQQAKTFVNAMKQLPAIRRAKVIAQEQVENLGALLL